MEEHFGSFSAVKEGLNLPEVDHLRSHFMYVIYFLKNIFLKEPNVLPPKSACNTPDLRGGQHQKILVDGLGDAGSPTPGAHPFTILDDANTHTQQQQMLNGGSAGRRNRGDVITPIRAINSLTVPAGGHGSPTNVSASPTGGSGLPTALIVPAPQDNTTTNAQSKRELDVRAFVHQSPAVDNHQSINSLAQQAGADHYLATLKDENNIANGTAGPPSNSNSTNLHHHHHLQTSMDLHHHHHHHQQHLHQQHHHMTLHVSQHPSHVSQQQVQPGDHAINGQLKDYKDYELEEDAVLVGGAMGGGRGRSSRARAVSMRYQQQQQQQQMAYDLEANSEQELDMDEFAPHGGSRGGLRGSRRSAPKKNLSASRRVNGGGLGSMSLNGGLAVGGPPVGGGAGAPIGAGGASEEYVDIYDLRPRFEVQYVKGIHLRLGEQGRRILKSLVQNKMHSDGEFRNWVRSQYGRVKCMTVVQLLAVAHEAGLWDAAVALAQQFARSKGSDLLRADPGVDEMDDGPHGSFDMGSTAGFATASAAAAANPLAAAMMHPYQQQQFALLMHQAASNPALAAMFMANPAAAAAVSAYHHPHAAFLPHMFPASHPQGALDFNAAMLNLNASAVQQQRVAQEQVRSQHLAIAAAAAVAGHEGPTTAASNTGGDTGLQTSNPSTAE